MTVLTNPWLDTYMTSTDLPNRDDVIKFRPVSRKNTIQVLVTSTSTLCGQTFVHGKRFDVKVGCAVSGARERAWMIEEFEVVG